MWKSFCNVRDRVGAPTTTIVLCIAEENFAGRQEPFAKETVPSQTRSWKPFFDICSAV